MYASLNDTDNLGLLLLDPISGNAYDINTQTLSPITNQHVIRATPYPVNIASGTPIMTSVFQYAKFFDDKGALNNNNNIVPFLVKLDTNGNIISIVDVWDNPYFGRAHSVKGGFSQR